jgi:DNA-binding CsgD family transcriptional regulator
MSAILEPTSIAYKACFKQIKHSLSILSEEFNLNKFYYYKIFESGSFFLFEGSSADLIEHFEEQQFPLKHSEFCHPQHRQPGHRISVVSEDPSFDSVPGSREFFARHGFNLWVRNTEITNNAVTEFGFNSAQSDETYSRFIANHFDDLDLFAQEFLKNNEKVFSFLEESAIHLPSYIGNSFYENRMLRSDPVNQERQKFLKKLGVQVDFKLSQLQVDIIDLISLGYSASQIPGRVCRAKKTVEHRIEDIKATLMCHSKVELIQKAQELKHLWIICKHNVLRSTI